MVSNWGVNMADEKLRNPQNRGKRGKTRKTERRPPLIEHPEEYKRFRLVRLFKEYIEDSRPDRTVDAFLEYCRFRGLDVGEHELYRVMNVRSWQEFKAKMGSHHELDYRVRLRVLDGGVDYVREHEVLPDPDHWDVWAEERDLPDKKWVEDRFGTWDTFLREVRKQLVNRYSYNVFEMERDVVKYYLSTGKLPDYQVLLRRYKRGRSFHPLLIIGLYGSFDNLKDEIGPMVNRVLTHELIRFSEWTDNPLTPDTWDQYAKLTDFVGYDLIKKYLEEEAGVDESEGETVGPVFLLKEFTPEITRTGKRGVRRERRHNNTVWYDHATLVGMVRELAEELGRTPKLNEFLERYDISVMNIRKYTKSYQNLLMDAGLPPNKILGSDEELLFLGREVVIRMGGCISSIQWEKLRKEGWVLPSKLTIFRRFGSWGEFWDAVAERFPEVADLIARTNKIRKRVYSREELIDMGFRIFKKEGHAVRVGEWKRIYKEEGLASDTTIVNQFGSFQAFWEEVAKEYPEVREKLDFKRKKYSYEELIEVGYQVFNHFGRIPTYPEWKRVEKEMNLPSLTTIRSRFKGYYDFWYEVGLHHPEVERDLLSRKHGLWTREEILNAGVMASYFLGHLPSAGEWMMLKKEYPDDFGWLPSVATCTRRFVSWENFLKEIKKLKSKKKK